MAEPRRARKAKRRGRRGQPPLRHRPGRKREPGTGRWAAGLRRSCGQAMRARLSQNHNDPRNASSLVTKSDVGTVGLADATETMEPPLFNTATAWLTHAGSSMSTVFRTMSIPSGISVDVSTRSSNPSNAANRSGDLATAQTRPDFPIACDESGVTRAVPVGNQRKQGSNGPFTAPAGPPAPGMLPPSNR